jgi:peroxiredoxin Q/BCP
MNLINQSAPKISLPDQDGKTVSLSDYKGKWLLLYFYPKDDTPGCTKEACDIRDSWKQFTKMGLAVMGVSADTAKSHKKFVQKYQLPFTLLADEEKTAVKAYGVWAKKKFMGKEYMGINRTSFLIDPKGRIVKIYEKVDPKTHAEIILKDFHQLSSTFK